MFSLKLDLLFPSLEAAKELARKLNPARKPPADPREYQRMRQELWHAHEKVKAQALMHRRPGL